MAALVLSGLAVLITVATWYVASLPALRTLTLGLNLFGTALLACAFSPTDTRGRGFFDRSYGSAVVLNRPDFYGGLIALAIAAVISAIN
jgi:hypothetical protein